MKGYLKNVPMLQCDVRNHINPYPHSTNRTYLKIKNSLQLGIKQIKRPQTIIIKKTKSSKHQPEKQNFNNVSNVLD